MDILAFVWIFFMPILVMSGVIGGMFLIIAGVNYRKLLVVLMGLLSFSFVVLPFVFWGMGIDSDKFLRIPTVLYWILFSLTGLLAGVNGIQLKVKSIRNMGFIIFSTGMLGAIFYYLMSLPNSFSI
ncbi:ammonia permease [Bacillus cytotoxicus]|uniref:Ammonia permease n=2 Tax=Bacillus cytotoxicus TaxID=580165 RepID=A0AAX2CM48_9BACI|nr:MULTISPECIES: hypothetical protein [Bacillus cereus group]ABS23472.1 conserved hypothetical protein [Bacillus cytotoxicus NVH 391-98]AWC30075.1 ammonia permease [Bacillus cytotoxicus]AWC34121.1 ammonia permease [Bacillus cytotoxicus]AWC38118.1 ammonia permease [Bacillus cytotoxicus]AWC42212.1 ammonia permease [Bacillus cytotoxicus]